ncbi:MAG: helix-turn-helix domain-containing protein, partial [Pirellulales bacterium]|nr:helix-turn-helix domain-containing protein [Pirellulales bacterium]
MLVEACSRLGIRVPDDLAVIGVGNMETTCEFCRVPLSTVERSGRRVGYEAAALLHRLIDGEDPPEDDILIQPEGVIRRASTDVVAVDEPHVAEAVRYISEHIDEEFGVETLERIVPVTRRWLEHQFKKHLRCTPHEFICRARVEKAKQLLCGEDNLTMRQISQACGFRDPHRFRLVFRRLTGMKPTEYRGKHRRKMTGG